MFRHSLSAKVLLLYQGDATGLSDSMSLGGATNLPDLNLKQEEQPFIPPELLSNLLNVPALQRAVDETKEQLQVSGVYVCTCCAKMKTMKKNLLQIKLSLCLLWLFGGSLPFVGIVKVP